MRVLVFGTLVDCTFRDVEELLKSYHVTDAMVRIYGDATLDDVENAIYESKVYRPAIIIANKTDTKNASNILKQLQAYNNQKLPLLAVSCETGVGLDSLGSALFNMMNIMRVYTKEPNQREYSRRPFTLKKGATVYELARSIHSDFSENFNFARVWAKRLPHSPQKAGLQFKLQDGDIIEIHLKQ
jgi:ribosome-interacting GTPase 1